MIHDFCDGVGCDRPDCVAGLTKRLETQTRLCGQAQDAALFWRERAEELGTALGAAKDELRKNRAEEVESLFKAIRRIENSLDNYVEDGETNFDVLRVDGDRIYRFARSKKERRERGS